MTAPLEGIRVLDIATFLAAPFCGTILADFGAEVIKIERPGTGDSLRCFGTPAPCGDSYVWLSEARHKRAATLDLRRQEGAALFRRLVAQSDVVLENFRPGTLERWGLGYADLARINPRLVMLSVSAYGQTGPYRDRPGFARVAHAFSGLAHLAGEPGRVPVVPGSTSLADYISGIYGAVGVLIALRHAERTGEGQHIDIGLYEPIFRLLDEIAPVHAATGFVRERMGADTVNVVPHSHYRSADGDWLALACSNDRMWQRLALAIERPELADDPRYATTPERLARREEVNALVSAWMGGLSTSEILARCEREEVPCAKLLTIEDIFADPQYDARANLLRVTDPRAGGLTLPAALPRMSRTPPRLPVAGAALGSSNGWLFEELLGLAKEEVEALRIQGII
ncbi:CaiB/BaiF CoA transferase family protein [Novosphingobium mathurense]|uniref:Crotonobetainyl-CoA:carnitine CoA-transferase CaiB n=1 Tax=Novosphingobium mathurense TaxID=428990 RepID=A0A1U6H646_9SPHN|nr:CoA transferase [Novosphingobium mathurense]SLJ91251.1 Crotonobetainyl-CoA:carnitine CoA-transferase CaiB [Novosphingobium mathurense]